MQLVREELTREAITYFRSATEWPFNAIFLFIRTYGGFAIAAGAVSHGDLFRILKDHADQQNHGDNLIKPQGDVYDGHIEWEADGTYFARTHGGKRLPNDLDQLLRSSINRLMNELP